MLQSIRDGDRVIVRLAENWITTAHRAFAGIWIR